MFELSKKIFTAKLSFSKSIANDSNFTKDVFLNYQKFIGHWSES